MSVKIDNVTLKLTTKRAGSNVSEIPSPEALVALFTTAQLNRISEEYLGKRFNKVARVKMAEKIFPVLVEHSGATEVKKESKKSARTYVVINTEIPIEEKLPPQCRKIGEIFAVLAADSDNGDRVEKTKDELLKALDDGGFVTKGNPWHNVMYYRATLIDLGVMER